MNVDLDTRLRKAAVSRLWRRMARARSGSWARPSCPAALPERDDAIWRAVQELPVLQAQAVVLHYVDDRPIAEIAQLLSCSEGAAKTHLERARQTLATTLENPDLGDHP